MKYSDIIISQFTLDTKLHYNIIQNISIIIILIYSDKDKTGAEVNSLERIITALERKVPDRVPHFELLISSKIINEIIPGGDLYDLTEKLELDGICVKPGFKKEKIGEDTYLDEKGQILKKTTQDLMDTVNRVIKDEKDLKKFEFPDPNAPHRWVEINKAIKRFKGKTAIISFIRDGWSEARDLHGFAETLMDLVDNPKLIMGIIEKAVEYYVEIGRISAKLGAEVVVTGDDLAGKNGMLMSPYHYKELLFPALKRLYKKLHSYGLFIIKHSDGNIYPIIDLLIEAGVDCLNPIDPTAGMSLAKVKKDYGKDICIMGNVNCAGSLVFGTEKDVEEEVRNCLKDGAEGGGYILSSSNSIPSDVKAKNYIAMVNAVKKYGVYK